MPGSLHDRRFRRQPQAKQSSSIARLRMFAGVSFRCSAREILRSCRGVKAALPWERSRTYRFALRMK